MIIETNDTHFQNGLPKWRHFFYFNGLNLSKRVPQHGVYTVIYVLAQINRCFHKIYRFTIKLFTKASDISDNVELLFF